VLDGFKIGVVIPCYRVGGLIKDVIDGIPDYVDVIVAVDDASPDATFETLESINRPQLRIVRHKANLGVGGAVVSGMREALKHDLDILVKLDGDGQMDPAMMIELIRPVAEGRCEYAKGNRFLHGQELRAMPPARLLGNIALTFLTKLSSGYWHLFDPQNGYLAVSVPSLRLLNLERLARRRYFFENEMLIQLNVFEGRALDVPFPARYGDEVSSLRIGTILLYFPWFLFRGFLSRLYHRYVLRDFSIIIPLYLAGFCLFGWGFVFGAVTWIEALKTNIPTPTGTIMLSVLPLILGLQMLLQGLMIDILQTPRAGYPLKRTPARTSPEKPPPPEGCLGP